MKIRNIFGNEYSGSIGKAVTASRWKGINYLRKYFIPANPRTSLQVNHRSLFTEAVDAWKLLDPLQKDFYDNMAVGMTGYNLYIREYLKAAGAGIGVEPPVIRELTVNDGAGYTLADASVVILRGSKTVFRGLTDEHGKVRFALTRKDGPYDLKVSGAGYTEFTAQNLCPNDISTATITPLPNAALMSSAC